MTSSVTGKLPRGVRIGADLLVRFAHQSLELRLVDTSLFDLHVHGDAM